MRLRLASDAPEDREVEREGLEGCDDAPRLVRVVESPRKSVTPPSLPQQGLPWGAVIHDLPEAQMSRRVLLALPVEYLLVECLPEGVKVDLLECVLPVCLPARRLEVGQRTSPA